MFVHHALVDYVVRLVVATRTPDEHGLPDVGGWVAYGASPRATLGIVAAARALALVRGRDYVLPQDVLDVAPDVLRHRLVLSYDAVADEVAGDRRSPGSCRPSRCRRSLPFRSKGIRCTPVVPAAAAPASWSVSAVRARSDRRPAVVASAVRRSRPRRWTAGAAHAGADRPGRLDGLLQGNHLGLVPGPGSEPGEARLYQPGDDVRRMDWSVTARTTQPHVRQTVADRELETWVVVDLSASLDFGTAGCEKRDLAVAAAAAVTPSTAVAATGIGALVATGEETMRVPARGGRMHAQEAAAAVATHAARTVGTRGDLAAAVEPLRRPARRRGLAVVISDFLGDRLEAPAAGAVGRHELLAVEVLDPRELELPDVGVVILPTPRPAPREVHHAAAVRGVRHGRVGAPGRGGPRPAALRGTAAVAAHRSDWIADVVRFVSSRRAERWRGDERLRDERRVASRAAERPDSE